jgi:hypothetical protein
MPAAARRDSGRPCLDNPPNRAGAWEVSTWSTRSAASMNDVDTDERRRTLNDEEGPAPTTEARGQQQDPFKTDHLHNADGRSPGRTESVRRPMSARRLQSSHEVMRRAGCPGDLDTASGD